MSPRCPLCPWEKQTGSTPELVSKTNLFLHTRDRIYLQRGTEPLTGRLTESSGPNSGSLSPLYLTFAQTRKTWLGCTLKKVHWYSYVHLVQYSPHQQRNCFCYRIYSGLRKKMILFISLSNSVNCIKNKILMLHSLIYTREYTNIPQFHGQD